MVSTRITEKLAERLKDVKVILTSDATKIVNQMQRRNTNTMKVSRFLEAIGFHDELTVTRIDDYGKLYNVKGWVRYD